MKCQLLDKIKTMRSFRKMTLGSGALMAEWKIVIILNLECKYIFRTDQVSVMKVKGSLDKCIKIWCHLVGELER